MGNYTRKDGTVTIAKKWIPPRKQCPLCPLYGTAKYVDTIHYQSKHLGQRNWPCDKCDYVSPSPTSLRAHKNSIHDKIVHQCPACDFSTKRPSGLNKHIRDNHMGAPVLQCELCSFQSVDDKKLKKHVDAEHLKIREECPECGYQARDKYVLTRHMKTHSMNIKKSNQCTYCDFSTPSNQYFDIHVNTAHLKIFKMKCSICDYKTNQATHFKEHMTSRHGVGGYKCSECDYKNAHQSNLDDHIKQVHMKVKDLICMHCETYFGTKAALKSHVLIKHSSKRQLKCNQCEYQLCCQALFFLQHVKLIGKKNKNKGFSTKKRTI